MRVLKTISNLIFILFTIFIMINLYSYIKAIYDLSYYSNKVFNSYIKYIIIYSIATINNIFIIVIKVKNIRRKND